MAVSLAKGSSVGEKESDREKPTKNILTDSSELFENTFESYGKVSKSFEDMNLKLAVVDRLKAYGFKKPVEMHQRVIMPLCEGRDLFVQARAEPGRMTAYCAAIVQCCEKSRECQYLVVTNGPARAKEIASVLRELAAHLPLIKIYACGEMYLDDIYHRSDIYNVQFQIIVGAYYQVKKMVYKEYIVLDHVRLVVVDSAGSTIDPTLNAIEFIAKRLPLNIQCAVFSELLSKKALKVFKLLLKKSSKPASPLKIVVENEDDLGNPREDMSHYVLDAVPYDDMNNKVVSLFSNWPANLQCLVFVGSFARADRIFSLLVDENVSAWVISPHMDQAYRDLVIEKYEEKSIDVLIMLFFKARDFRVKGSVIINCDMDRMPAVDEYLERIARFGRGGGVVINQFSDDALWYLFDIRESGVEVHEMPLDFSSILQNISTA